ncbi:MAG: hypothetical protein WC712_11035 [Candidatus Brocadiia bacterium]
MTLLQEIQAACVDPNTDIVTLLRKCKILAVRLGNNEFKKWVDSELSGYGPSSERKTDWIARVLQELSTLAREQCHG